MKADGLASRRLASPKLQHSPIAKTTTVHPVLAVIRDELGRALSTQYLLGLGSQRAILGLAANALTSPCKDLYLSNQVAPSHFPPVPVPPPSPSSPSCNSMSSSVHFCSLPPISCSGGSGRTSQSAS